MMVDISVLELRYVKARGDYIMYRSTVTGKVIRDLRKKRGVTQEVLSGFACISRSHLAMIETGAKNANVDTLWRIAEALEMPLSELFSLVEAEIEQQNEQYAK